MARRDKRPTAPKPAPAGPARLPRLPGPPGLGRWLQIAAALWLVLALLYPGAMFRGEVFGSADAANSDAFTVTGDQSLAQGHYPLWNPYLFAGMPSFPLVYARFVYPPSLVLETLQRHLGFPPLTWLLAHLLFGGLGMAWLLSRWKLPLPAVLMGAAAWLLLPKVVAWSVSGHGSKMGAAMYLPWIVGWAWRVLDGKGARAVAMTGLLMGLQLLRGHPQISYYTLLLVGWLAVWNAVWPLDQAMAAAGRAVRWRRVGLVAGGLVLGFLVAAVLLVPIHQYAGISIRGQDTAGGGGVGLDYATGWSLSPREVGTFVLPAAAGFGKATYLGFMPFNDYPNYFGVLMLVLAVAACGRGARALCASLGLMSLLAVFVSFGDLGFGLYELLYKVLPYFNKLRIPSMILVLVGFAAIVLAARGIAAWRDDAVPGGRPVAVPAVLGLVGLVMLVGGAGSVARSGYESGLASLARLAGKPAPQVLLDQAWLLQRASLIRIGLVLLTAAAALWYSLKNAAFRRGGIAWVLAALVAVDLAGVDRLIAHPEAGLQVVGRDQSGRGVLMTAGALGHEPEADRGQVPPGPAADALKAAAGHGRIWPLGSDGGRNTWMADGIRSLGGYHPAKLAAYEQIRKRLYASPPAARLADWLGADVVVYDQPFDAASFAYLDSLGLDLDRQPLHAGRPSFYRNRAALPRARLVDAWRPASALPGGGALPAFLDAIQAGAVDVADTVTLAAAPEPAPEPAPGPLPVPEFVTDGMDEVVLKTDAPVPTVLVLADMNAPGWRVEVDGRGRPLLAADLVLRGVALEAGAHTVRFVYTDPSVKAGLSLSIVGVVLVAALLVFPTVRRRRAAAAGGDHE